MTQPRIHTLPDAGVGPDPASVVGVLPEDAGSIVGQPEAPTDRRTFLEEARRQREALVSRVVEYEQVAIPTWDNRLRATFRPLEEGPRKRLAEAFSRMKKAGNDQQARDWACGIIGEACVGLTLDGVEIGSGVHGGFGPDFAFIVDLPEDADLAALVWAAFDREESVFMPFYGALLKWFTDPIPAVHDPEVDGPFAAG